MNPGAEKNNYLKIQKRNILLRLVHYFLNREPEYSTPKNESQELIEEIKHAKDEWMVCNTNFDYANEEEMIDYYTYKIMACQTRYQYLIKKAKEKGIRLEFVEDAYTDHHARGILRQ